jgi:hypothetical protein
MKKNEQEKKEEAAAKPEPVGYYTVVKGPIRVGSMIIGRGHQKLRLSAAQAAALGDNVRREMPTV